MIVPNFSKANLEKVQNDLKFVIECFGEVLEDLGEGDLAKTLPWINQNDDSAEIEHPWRTAQTHSIAFQLLNMVEENASVQMRRKMEGEGRLVEFSGLWQNNLVNLQKLGLSEEKIASSLGKIQVEPGSEVIGMVTLWLLLMLPEMLFLN